MPVDMIWILKKNNLLQWVNDSDKFNFVERFKKYLIWYFQISQLTYGKNLKNASKTKCH